MPFEFVWAVKDEQSYNDYSHQAKSDGKNVNGVYRVVLPDGRTQTVAYKANDDGYVADVQYEGEAKYSDYKPVYKAAYPKPSYTEPAYPKPSYPEPSYPEPAYPKPSYTEPAIYLAFS